MLSLEAGQLLRVDVVVGDLARIHRRLVVGELDGGQEVEGVAQIRGALTAHGSGAGGRREAVAGAHLGQARGHREQTRHLDDGGDAALLDVERVGVAAALFQHETAEEAQRGFAVGGELGQVRVEALGAFGDGHVGGAQVVDQLVFAVDAADVEERLGVEQRIGVGLGDPQVELRLPLRQAHAPIGVRRHHVAGAQRVAAFGERVADEVGEPGEVVAVSGFVVGVVDDEGVVLVGGHAHLAAPLGAEDHEGVRHRRGAEFFFAQRQQAAGDGVGGDGEQAGDLVGGHAALDEAADDAPRVGGDLGDLGDRALAGQRGRGVDGVGVQGAQQVADDDHAHHSRLVGDRQVVVAAFGHEQHRLERQHRRVDGDRVRRHDVADDQLRSVARCEHAAAQIAVGEDAGEFPVVDDEQRGDVAFAHQLGALPDRRAGADVDGIAGHEVGDAGAQRVGGRGAAQVRGHGADARVLAAVVLADVREAGDEIVEDLVGDDQQQRVLHRRHGVQRRFTRQQGGVAEVIAVVAPVEQRARGVEDVHEAGANDEDRVVGSAGGDDLLPTAGVAHGQPGRQLPELLVRQFRKRRGLAEEIADFVEFDGHGASWGLRPDL